MAEMFEPQSLCAWERRKSITMETPIMQSLVFFFFFTPLHFALLSSPFFPSYSYHLHLFPPFSSSTEPWWASSHLIIPSPSVACLSTILSRSPHRGVALGILLGSLSLFFFFCLFLGKIQDFYFTQEETVLPPTFTLKPHPSPIPTHPSHPISHFSDVYVDIMEKDQ